MEAIKLLDQLHQVFDCQPAQQPIDLQHFVDEMGLANTPVAERLSAGLQVCYELLSEENLVLDGDQNIVESLIYRLDQRISHSVNQVREDEGFRSLESLWKGLAFLVKRLPENPSVQIEILSASKAEWADDFSQQLGLTETALYHHVYNNEYDTPGGEPFAAMITPYEFSAEQEDIALLDGFARIAALAHCPFMANVGAAFFLRETIAEVMTIRDFNRHFEKSAYIPWRGFRRQEHTRFVGLCFPKFLLDQADTQTDPRYHYYEAERAHCCWGAASFAFATTMVKSFHQYGWCVNIRGPETGGKVAKLPMIKKLERDGVFFHHPVECLISESTELAMAKAGIIPFTYYKNRDFACFFSANSLHLAKTFDDPKITANHRINARLPYIFLISRIAHYLKVLQRERIGSQKTAAELSNELNAWLKTLITKMNHPSPELQSTHPLSDGLVEVSERLDSPGYFRVQLYAKPHFQVEGIDITLNLTAQLPNNTTN